jgi:2-succinyl-5-enolpyruvyl-6-hydroxy-3-cyclohexene-1-carboxylate synthase
MPYLSLAPFNAERSRLVVQILKNQGIHHFCIAPGSRSTPLALAMGENLEIKTHVHFDERGLGFYALGLAKALNEPVALLVTTGTAVANLLPAIMEAHLSRTPLLILTADRPPELRDCGSNQTADHIKIFTSFVQWEIDLAFSDPLASDEYIISSLSYGVSRCMTGPVHINCMIREPFIHLEALSEKKYSSCVYEPKLSCPPLSSFKLWGKILSEKKQGVILLGSDALKEQDLDSFLVLAEKLQWPIFSDIISGGRQLGDHPCHIEHFELILKAFPDFQVDCILQIGNRFVSKLLGGWIQKQNDVSYLLVTDHLVRQDPLHKVSRKMECTTGFFCKLIQEFITPCDIEFISFLQTAKLETKQIIHEHFLESNELTEPALFSFLSNVSPALPLYLSSSMPVRDADLLFYPKDGSSLVFCNRGASGIDGNIATAAGIAEGLQRPLVAVLGDLATLHDLNSFALAHKGKTPIIFVVINNQGGGIFSFLPVAQKKTFFEEFIATSHEYSFELIAQTFGLPHKQVSSFEDWNQAWDEAIKSKSSFVIECSTKRDLNVTHHQDLYEKIKCSFTKPLEVPV